MAMYTAPNASVARISALATMTIQSVDSTPYTNAATRRCRIQAPTAPATTAGQTAAALFQIRLQSDDADQFLLPLFRLSRRQSIDARVEVEVLLLSQVLV